MMAPASRRRTRTFKTGKTGISLPAAVRGEMIDLLDARLADTLDLFAQTRQAHWDVKGPEFHQLHLLLDARAAPANAWGDPIAERVAMLGAYANGNREAIDEADAAEDATTADLLTGISRQADMDLWFQEAHLQDR